MTASPNRPRGRPRDPDLDATVLRAAADVLVDSGYARLRIGDVAARAGVGLGALYRRWPGKRELVLAALAHVVPDRAVPDTEDPAADVLAGLKAISEAAQGPLRALLTGLLAEMDDDPELATAVHESVLAPVRAAHRERMRRLVGDAPDLDVRADLGPAYILLHTLFLGRAVTDAELLTLLCLPANTPA